MIYYFSAPSNYPDHLLECSADAFLLSFAVDAKIHWEKFHIQSKKPLIIDSGAFSAWNVGKKIDIDEYITFCKTLPEDCIFINLDVIPKTGSTPKDVEICCEEGLENFLYLQSHLKNVMPVYHYKDKIEWLKKYSDHTDYIGISPANDTPEKVKRVFLNYVFQNKAPDMKTHALGYTSFDGMKIYPFYSVDSTSWKQGGRFANVGHWNEACSRFETYDGRQFFANKYKDDKEMVDMCLNHTIKSILKKMQFLKEHHEVADHGYLTAQQSLF